MRKLVASTLASAFILASAPFALAQALTVEAVVAACSAGPCQAEIEALADQTPAAERDAVLIEVVTALQNANVPAGRVAAAATAAAAAATSAETRQGLTEVASANSADGNDLDGTGASGA